MPISQFHERISQLVALMKSTPRAEGVNEIMVPGEPEHRKFLIRQAEGIGIDEALIDELGTMADELGIRPLER